jgi:hypothetical protein
MNTRFRSQVFTRGENQVDARDRRRDTRKAWLVSAGPSRAGTELLSLIPQDQSMPQSKAHQLRDPVYAQLAH